MANRLDFPETHLQAAGVALTLRNLGAATGAFREAAHLDPQLTDAWVMLVRIAGATDGGDAPASVRGSHQGRGVSSARRGRGHSGDDAAALHHFG
jgi:hypothetical protein